jgi:DSF synthase
MPAKFHGIFRDYSELSLRYDVDQEALWCYFNPSKRPCFSPQQLQDIKTVQKSIIDYFQAGISEQKYPIHYVVLASQTPGVFSLGGDLDLFIQLIKEKDRDQLLAYAVDCIDICYMNAMAYNLPLTTITLVQGSSLGGGFESALSGNFLIAEEQAKMGLPEIRFNLFPGMGAFSFIARKAGMKIAEQILSEGNIFGAPELHKMGIVDVLAESGQGYEAVGNFIKKHKRLSNGLLSIQQVKRLYNPITYDELYNITKIWVETALRLSDKDLHVMERLVKAQTRGSFSASPGKNGSHLVRTYQDRRFENEDISFPLVDHSGNLILADRRKFDRRCVKDVQLAS